MSSKSPMELNEGVSDIATSGVEYEVFLSFRGPDTRSSFTDHLYVRLTDAGIRTYRDDEELRKGKKIGPELLKGIRESKIAIPIFSKNYAASKWCLKELVQIVECKRSNNKLKVMPVFYDVTPSDVRNQTGDYAKAFESHEQNYDENTIKSWKAALREVGELSGWESHTGTSRFFKKEGELTKEITKVVLRALKKAYLVVTDHLLGVDYHAEKISSMLSTDTSAIQVMGIYGMGGIGKTTLAKHIYNRLLHNFDSHSFLADIRETSRSKGMKSLYETLIGDILGKESANISSNDEGIHIIRTRFSNKKVVVLLDDVDEISQLEGLIGRRDCYGCGSRIIVTTRNKRILDLFQVDWSYELVGLETLLALQLFSKHAFRKDNPPREYSTLSERAVEIAAGLPLALEVFGSLLCGKSSREWISILNKLEKVPPQEICRRLRVSFDTLDVQQKQIFIDIACFFIGEDYRIVIHFWEKSQFPQEAIEVLQQMSLIKVQEDNKLWMHDQLRDLGRDIAREEASELEKCSRLWNKEEATELLMRNKGNENIQGICVDITEQPHYYFSSGQFTSLPNLRLLRVNCERDYLGRTSWKHSWHRWYSKIILEDYLPPCRGPFVLSKLRWLSWPCFPGMHEIRNISLENLAILNLNGSSIKSSSAWWIPLKMAKKLKVLDLTDCWQLVKTPDFSSHPLLEQLILSGCRGLVEIDKSISMLKHLVVIDLRYCWCVKELPKELSCMDSLEEFLIFGSGIVEIPNWPLMRKLTVFDSGSCSSLSKVSSLVFAINITELTFAYSSITILPDSIGKLVNLLKLSLEECKRIKTLPESIGDLVSLVELELTNSGIIELPNTFGNLKDLKTLDISGTPLSKLPAVMGTMENLVVMYARDCSELQDIPKLPSSLTSFDISNCKSLEISLDLSHLRILGSLSIEETSVITLTGLCNLECLETLTLEDCEFSVIDDLNMLVNLKALDITRCINLLSLPNLSNLKKLERLHVSFCPNLVKIPSNSILENLTDLTIEGCAKLQRLLDLSNLKKLRCLHVRSCPNLVEMLANSMLENLTDLTIGNCAKLRGLLDLSNLKKLERLCVSSCPNLVEIPNNSMLENLTDLTIEDYVKLQGLLDLSNLKKLECLCVSFCPNLVEIPSNSMLENLTNLTIEDCAKLQGFDLSNLKKLRCLHVRSCPNLVEILGNSMLENLTDLNIGICAKLQGLPDLSNLKKLERLCVSSCPNLVVIPGNYVLENLTHLTIMNCAKLQGLLDLSNFKKLECLHVSSCPNLVEILSNSMLENLTDLTIEGCAKLQRLLDLSNLKKLRCLHVRSCPNLVEILSNSTQENLTNLTIGNCAKLRLLDLSNLKKLERLCVSSCPNLVEILGISVLENLLYLDISDCAKLQGLADLSNLKKLEHLNVCSCPNLVEFLGICMYVLANCCSEDYQTDRI